MFFSMNFYSVHFSGVIILVNYAPFFKFTRTFNCPVVHVFMVKTTFVTDEFIYFVVFIFSTGYALNLISEYPKRCFSTTFITITVSVKWFVEPYPGFETESFVEIGRASCRERV